MYLNGCLNSVLYASRFALSSEITVNVYETVKTSTSTHSSGASIVDFEQLNAQWQLTVLVERFGMKKQANSVSCIGETF